MIISTCISGKIARPVRILEGVIAGVGSLELMCVAFSVNINTSESLFCALGLDTGG